MPAATRAQMREVAENVPLVYMTGAGGFRFAVHDSVREQVLTDLGRWPGLACTASTASSVLAERGDYVASARVAELLPVSSRTDWIRIHGEAAVDAGAAADVRLMLEDLGLGELVCSPGLLLLHASALIETGDYADAAARARTACLISATDAPDVRVRALILLSQCHAATGSTAERRRCLEEAVADHSEIMDPAALVESMLSLATISMYCGEGEQAILRLHDAERLAHRHSLPQTIHAKVAALGGAVAAVVCGDWTTVARSFRAYAQDPSIGVSERVRALGNQGVALCEMGRTARCQQVVTQALEVATAHGLDAFVETFEPVLFAAQFAEEPGGAHLESMRRTVDESSAEDAHGTQYNRVYLSTMLRAAGMAVESLREAEVAAEVLASADELFISQLALLEVAASLVASGDRAAGRTAAMRISGSIDVLNRYHTLRADMILAEIDRSEGRLGEAIERLAEHRDYILTESSNWQIAMYCRAFPGLLGVFVEALGGADQLPSHLLRMIPAESAEAALGLSRETLAAEEWAAIGTRLLGAQEFDRWRSRDGRPLCRVRLFGGLDVSVGGDRVADGEWRKRKARLLFAMLAVRRGRDVTRDQLQEYLWPDMDETRSRNNLYVTWNAMKSVLMRGETRGECPYVTNAGGRCRIDTDNVWTDLDEFEAALAAARQAEADNRPAQAIEAYSRAADVYRGDLLPGDLYDEWFAATRDHYRGEYCDAMYRAAELLVDGGDPGSAVVFARRGLSADGFREDLYQAALRGQIASGQRGAAVDTYLQCRTKLADELGLDPSPETQALYEKVLGMEENPRAYLSDGQLGE